MDGRPTTARTAALVRDIARRLEGIGRLDDDRFEWPVSQALPADTLGITPVHVSRVLRRLRAGGILELSGRTIHILSRERLDALVDGERVPSRR
jgi:CRP-like cAMP-binding protein